MRGRVWGGGDVVRGAARRRRGHCARGSVRARLVQLAHDHRFEFCSSAWTHRPRLRSGEHRREWTCGGHWRQGWPWWERSRKQRHQRGESGHREHRRRHARACARPLSPRHPESRAPKSKIGKSFPLRSGRRGGPPRSAAINVPSRPCARAHLPRAGRAPPRALALPLPGAECTAVALARRFPLAGARARAPAPARPRSRTAAPREWAHGARACDVACVASPRGGGTRDPRRVRRARDRPALRLCAGGVRPRPRLALGR